MNMYYYIPINSLNFNNVLSSESISPISFYEKRGFGFKRFERINANPLQNSILAYNKVPLLSDIRSDREEFPLYIGIPEKYLSASYSRKSNDDINIIQLDKSIYINWMECFFFARTEDEKKKIIASTRRSIEVKNVDNYISNIYVLEDYDIDSFTWNESVIADFSDAKNSNQSEILRDQKINKFKGFVYGYASGKLKEQPQEMAEGSRYFQEFINSYSALLNDLSVLSRNYKGKTRNFDYASVNKALDHLKDIKERIEILFGAFEQSDIDKLIEEKFNAEKSHIEILKKLQYGKTRITMHSLASDFLKDKDSSLHSIEDLLDILIKNIKDFINYSSVDKHKALQNNFNEFTALINKKIRDFRSNVVKENELETISITIDQGLTKINTSLDELSEEENSMYSLVINEILSRTELSSTDEIAQRRQDIIKNVGLLVAELKGKDSESASYLRKLFKSLQTVGVGFKINESEDNALKSLACFLSRYTEMEKLQDFMDRNKYYHYSLTFGIWGTAYGYANISKILMDALTSDKEKLNLVTKFISQAILNQDIDEKSLSSHIKSFGEKKTHQIKPKWKIEVEPLNEEDKYEKETIDKKPNDSNQTKDDTSITNEKGQLDMLEALEKNENSDEEGPVVVDLKIDKSKKELGFVDAIKQDEVLGKRNDWIELIEASFNLFNEKVKSDPDMGIGTKKHLFENTLKDEKKARKIKGFGPEKKYITLEIFTPYIQ